MTEVNPQGEFLKIDVPQTVDTTINYKGKEIKIFLWDKSGKQEINDLQKTILSKLSNEKEMNSIDMICKKIYEKEIEEGLNDENYFYKYDGIHGINIHKDGVLYVWSDTIKINRQNQKERYSDTHRVIRISKYKNISTKGENYMYQKAYGEFMKNETSSPKNKKTVQGFKVKDVRDQVYGRVLELEKLFFYSDDADEDVTVKYVLEKGAYDLKEPQFKIHSQLVNNPEDFLNKLEKLALKGKSKLIKTNDSIVLLSSIRYLYIQPNGDIVVDMYGYYGEGDSKPSMDNYEYYDHVDDYKISFNEVVGKGESMNLNEIMNRTAFGESVVTSGEYFGVGEFDEVDKYLKEFQTKKVDDEEGLLKKEHVQSAESKDVLYIFVQTKGKKVSTEAKKKIKVYMNLRMTTMRNINRLVFDQLKKDNIEYGNISKSFLILQFLSSGNVILEYRYTLKEVGEVTVVHFNLTRLFEKKLSHSGESFFSDLVKVTKNKFTQFTQKHDPQFIEKLNEHGWVNKEKGFVSFEKSFSFDGKGKGEKGYIKETVVFSCLVKDGDVNNLTLKQKQVYHKLAKSNKEFLELYKNVRRIVESDITPSDYVVWIDTVLIKEDGEIDVFIELERKDTGTFEYYKITVAGILNKKTEWQTLNTKKESLTSLRDGYIKAMKLSALSESMDDLRGPVKSLSERMIKIKDNILDFAAFAENVEPSDFAGVAHLQDRKDLIMQDIKTVTNVLDKSDKELNDHYQDSVTNSILALMTVNDAVKAKDLVECPAEKIVKDNTKDIEEIKALNPAVGKVVEDKYEEVKDSLKNEENDLIYDPTEKKNGLIPVAEMPSGEGFFAYGEDAGDNNAFVSNQNQQYRLPANWQKGATILAGVGGVGAGLALLHTLLAVPFNIWLNSKNNKVEKQFGSALNIQQPLVATDDISKDVVNSYAKYLETSSAIQIKQALESSIAQTDGGNLMSRAKSSLKHTFTKMNKTDRSGKNIKEDADEVLSSFSQSYTPVMDCMTKVFSRNAEAASLIFNIQNLVSSGEAGEFINDNKHAPKSTIQVEILYKDISDVTSFSRKTMSKKSSLTVDVSSRKLPYEDVIKTLLEMNDKYFNTVKVTPAEKNTEKSLKNSIIFVKKEGTSKEKQVLTSNKFADIINKVERIKTPLFHLVISNQAYHELKHRGIDIKNKDTYRKIMKRLPIISIAIADEDTEIMSTSQGPYPMFRDIQFKDLENEISKYEKELQSMIKFGAQR